MLANLSRCGLVLLLFLGGFLGLWVFGKEGLNHLTHCCGDRFYEFRFLI